MKMFGRRGRVFAAPSKIAHDIVAQYKIAAISKTEDVLEQFFVISAERRIKHPALDAIVETARQRLFK